MNIIHTHLPEILILEPQVFGDERGFFMETYNARKLAAFGITANFVQDNQSRSRQGTLRGLHYQIHQPQGKLIRATLGEIFDVAVDMRRHSPTFGQWVGVSLSAENKRQIWIPPGFAHGFYAVSEQIDLQYKATDFYAPEWERTLLWNDPQLNIDWPLIPGRPPLLSPKDLQGKNLDQAEVYDW
jgi:dTDP-4-dehydrorhamnose 3,5-epimerase